MAKYHITFTHSFPFSSDYFKGLNYLLNEEPDKAIDIFIKLIEVDNETVETHLALGALFRRRGEVNRAIRIHHNLTTRTTLTTAQRSLAQLELALDYRRAGLLDRAESLFLELLNFKQHQALALQQLLDIYQQEHEWDKANGIKPLKLLKNWPKPHPKPPIILLLTIVVNKRKFISKIKIFKTVMPNWLRP